MLPDIDLSARIALDANALDDLKARAVHAPDKALRHAATQFEAVFMNMLMKSMRETLGQDGLFDSQTTRTYTSMLDQQLAQTVSKRGMGLADMMVHQLSRYAKVDPADGANGTATGAATHARPTPGATAPSQAAQRLTNAAREARAGGAPQSFIDRMLPHARAAERQTGLPAQFVLGQAALESGWGRREIRGADGTASHNLFGIKAGRGWTGKTVDVTTTEYVDGRAQKVVQKFRAYDSYAAAFADWTRLLGNSPRYTRVLQADDAAQFAQGLQRAGYATDPQYAEKLTQVINHRLLRQTIG